MIEYVQTSRTLT